MNAVSDLNILKSSAVSDSKVYGAYMGPTWGRQDPGGIHVGPMILAMWGVTRQLSTPNARVNKPSYNWLDMPWLSYDVIIMYETLCTFYICRYFSKILTGGTRGIRQEVEIWSVCCESKSYTLIVCMLYGPWRYINRIVCIIYSSTFKPDWKLQ